MQTLKFIKKCEGGKENFAKYLINDHRILAPDYQRKQAECWLFLGLGKIRQ
jgi:hypothetical protein